MSLLVSFEMPKLGHLVDDGELLIEIGSIYFAYLAELYKNNINVKYFS